MAYFEGLMSNFTTKEEFKKLKEYSKGFAHISLIEEFKSKMQPKINSCEKLIGEFSLDNTSMKECVMNMDREMCNKVNKIT